MKAREAHDTTRPDLLYGLGLYRQPLRYSLVWGHNGDVPGYNTTAFNSADGTHQVVFMVDTDSDSLTPAELRLKRAPGKRPTAEGNQASSPASGQERGRRWINRRNACLTSSSGSSTS